MSWTAAETAEFMSLLAKFPAEKYQTHRWRKISEELKSKTPKQVASKAQKLFAKLRKVRRRIPGSQEQGKALTMVSSEPDSEIVNRSNAKQLELAKLATEKEAAEKLLERLEFTNTSIHQSLK